MTNKNVTSSGIFDPLTIKGLTFKNRVLRSSIGGRHSTYDGTVTDVWKNFEKRFAQGGVGAIISTTFHVNRARLSPMQYPSIAEGKFKGNLARHIEEIKSSAPDLKYIIQIGDPGYVTYESLFRDQTDSLSSYGGFDLAFGYQTTRNKMAPDEIKRSIEAHAQAAKRVLDVGADGVEIAAAKGYLIHQFLNPLINRRTDEWGGDAARRFKFFEGVVDAVHDKVGGRKDFLIGVRLAAGDYNLSPPAFAALRWPSPWLAFGERRHGNSEQQMIEYAKKLQRKVDYLHIVSGFGFPSPRETPGKFPFDEVKQFFHATHMLTGKTRARSAALAVLPSWLLRWWLSLGWRFVPAINRDAAARFKKELRNCKIIVNGGFRERGTIEEALASGSADMVSMARALLANPDLLSMLRDGHSAPSRCSGCNKCVGRTGTSPLGCYDVSRFGYDTAAMYRQILSWNEPDRFDINDVRRAQQARAEQQRVEPSDEEGTSPPQDLEIVGTSITRGGPSPPPGHG